MRFNPKARIDPSQIETRGRSAGSVGGGGGMAGSLIAMLLRGRLSWKLILLVVVIYVAIQLFSGNSVLPGGLPGGDDSPAPTQSQNQKCQSGADANESLECAVPLLTTSIQNFWSVTLQQQEGKAYQKTRTVMFTDQVQSACGAASSAMGPFYCPADSLVFLDISFMKDMLEGQLGARGGPFALAYVLAHEYGHHIENQLGFLAQARTQQGPKSDAVKVELMADCLAGMWAGQASSTEDPTGQQIIAELTPDDIERAIDAAQKVGDDYIQRRSGGSVNEESWTHGSSAQRVHWFNVGMQRGSLSDCNTFAPGAL